MMQQRRNPVDVTVDLEDAGLFQRKLLVVDIDLTPEYYWNSRQDLLFRGFLRNREISVLFAGRRTAEARFLHGLITDVLKTRRIDRSNRNGQRVGCRTQIEGAWRTRFERDPTGWETKSYQLIAARWSLIDARGTVVQFGCLPKMTSDPS
jgi:hypothetical protein